MKQKLLLLTGLFSLVLTSLFAQVAIVVPSTPDTVVCNGAPLTLQAQNQGYASHVVGLSVDDDYSGVLPIGFTFNFYGNNYTQFVISSNGYISFNTSEAGSFSAYDITAGIPGNSDCRNAVCGVYEDLYPLGGGTISYGVAGVAPYRKLVVDFCNIPFWSCTAQKTTFQIILYETTNIAEVHTRDKGTCTAWGGKAIQGVENNAFTIGTPAPGRNFSSPVWSVTTPDARRFTPSGTTYTCDTIAFNPIPDSNAIIHWATGGVDIGTGPTVTVSPSTPTTYEAYAVSCSDTSRAFVNVTIGNGPTITGLTTTAPTYCGSCNGTVTVSGLAPGTSDTITYNYNGVPQPAIVLVPNAAGNVTITGLCAGIYGNFIAKVGYCSSLPYNAAIISDPPFNITYTSSTMPTVCGECNGSITFSGLVPGMNDTLNYTKNGVAQPPIYFVAPATGSYTLNNLCSGSYSITVKMNSCTTPAIGPIAIIDPAFTITLANSSQPTVCGACNGSITIGNLIPGTADTLNYTKDGVPQTPVYFVAAASGQYTMSNLCAGAYDISVKMNTCVATLPVFNLVNPPFGISSTSSTNTTCSMCDGTITLYGLPPGQSITVNYNFMGTPQAPYTSISTPAGTVTLTNLCYGPSYGPGIYDNITASVNTCTSAAVGPIQIFAPPLIPITITNSTQPSECGACNGSITIKGVPPGSIDTIFYNMNGGVQPYILTASSPDSVITMYNLCAGTYDNFFIKVGPCPTNTINTGVTLTDPPINAAFTTVVHPGCNGDTVYFYNTSTAPGAVHIYYSWNFGDGFSDTAANPVHVYTAQGSYVVTLNVSNHHCNTQASASLNLVHPIQAVFTVNNTTNDTVCQNTPFSFTNASIGNPPTYVWMFGDGTTETAANPTHSFNNAGTYTVALIATNYVPCSDTAYHTIFVDSQSTASVSLTDTVICAGTYITFTGQFTNSGLTSYTWNFGNGDSLHNVNPVIYAYNNIGTFTVTETSYYHVCQTASASRTVTVVAQPSINLGRDTSICEGGEPIYLSDYVNAGNPAATWLWSTGATTNGITISSAGNYYATVTVGNCAASDSVTVLNDCYMAVPNVFTPNGDGTNDYFNPRDLLGKGLTEFKMNIFNRWGQLIFSTTSLDGRGWDGMFNNTPQPEGVYIYVIDGTFVDGKKEHHQGNITLMK